MQWLGQIVQWPAQVCAVAGTSCTLRMLSSRSPPSVPPLPPFCAGTPAYSQQGTGAYNGNYHCTNLLQPIAALFSFYNIPFQRLLVLGMHKQESKSEWEVMVLGGLGLEVWHAAHD